MAINPKNSNNIVIGWMALDATTGYKMSIKTKTSFDGGATWANPDVKPHFSSTWGSADVSIAFRNNGTVYLNYIDYRQSPDSGGVYITHSTDGGITWSPPTRSWNVNTEDPVKVPLDRPWLRVDNSNSPNQGMFYLTTKPAPWILPPNRAYLKTSSDSGQTWSTFRYVDTTGHLIGSVIQQPMAALSVAADGALCITFPSYLAVQSPYPKYYFAKSYNKGASFSFTDLLVNPVAVPNQNYKLGYVLSANPQNANQIAAGFITNQNGDPDAFVSTTNNGGLTWSPLVRVNDDAISNGVGQDLIWISYSTNNKLLAVWRDKRNGGGTGYYQPSDMYCAVSLNNGATFQPNVRLSSMSAPHDTILTQPGNDFSSCELVNDTIYAAWGDVRTGKLNIYFAKTSIVTGLGIKTIINGEDQPSVSIFPNPASEKLVLRFNDPNLTKALVSVFSFSGEKIIEKSFANIKQTENMDISALKAGTYFIKVESQNKIVYFDKILVMR